MDPFFFSAGICHQERGSPHGFARSTFCLIALPRSNCSKRKSEEDCFPCLFFPTSPSPALSICWFCQSDLNSKRLSGFLTTFPGNASEAKMHPRQERCHSRLFLCLLPFLGAAAAAWNVKPSSAFPSPPIWMGMDSSQGSCQRRQQPPGASSPPL